jgi:ATP-dependent exoDNAse (exonuclease V) beta subunit
VIVADITEVTSERSRQLLYTAATRAKHRLIVLLDEAERPGMRELIIDGGNHRGR